MESRRIVHVSSLLPGDEGLLLPLAIAVRLLRLELSLPLASAALHRPRLARGHRLGPLCVQVPRAP
jgi:hypothetical protein